MFLINAGRNLISKIPYMNGGDTSESTTIEVPALGRPFLLGMLYDRRNDTLIPGVTLWNGDALRSDVESKKQENTSFELLTSDTISDKSFALNVSASLKASFLSGLVNVDGSANYLNDIKSSNHQARVTLKYSRTTKFDQLTMNHLGSKNMTHTEVFDKGTATHVVTAILYGAQAFFIFDREVSSSENTQDIQGNLEVIIKKIPSFSIEGKGDVTLTDREKQSKNTFSCKFYGDFALDSNPVNYEDAINLYKSLPKRLGENGEEAVPVKVWLYPLKKLDNRAAQLLREISENNLYKAEAIIQQMTDVKMRCNDLMRHLTAKNFPDMKRSIGQFREYCEQFTLMFQKQLAHTLTSIRRDQLDEEKLMDVLIRAERSPFGKLQVEEYLSRRQQEMDTVESFINKLHPVKVLSSEHELNKVVTDPKVQYIVCYCFTSLNDEEEYLSDLRKWLHTDESSTNDIHQSNKVELWIKNKELYIKARRYLQEFQEFSQSNTTSSTQSNTLRQNIQYIISAFCDTNNPGASIRLYEAGSLVNDRFSPPAKPSPPTILSVTHERVKLSLKPADYGKEFVTGYKIGYRIHNEEKWDNHTIETPAQEVTFKGLQPNKTYEFRCSSMCKAGLSAVSDLVTGRTLPTSPPEFIQCNADPTCLQLQWKEPSVKGEGVIIRGYKVQYKHENQSWSEMRTKTKRENCEIRGLNPETVYTIRVLAVCGDHGVSAPSDEKVISTPKKCIKYQLLKDSTLLTKAKPSVHQLKTIYSESGYRKFVLGEENSAMGSKVILLVGATGSGKTTLINGMANYILGVDWNDDVRFKLVHEVTNQSEAHSQTSQVTAYEINHNPGYKIPYSLTLIDTPGFGDTRGIEQDKKITESISKFFTSDDSIDQIDAVCFVVQASLARLTHTQKYIFNAVFSIFGKDIKDNIFILINFCDGEKPPVLEAIKTGNIPCTPDSNGDPTHFKFNNSALFANNQSSNVSFNQMFWDMGAHSMETFFTSLGKLEAKSLKLTKEVLQERKKLEVNLQGLQPQIKAGLVKLEEIRKTEINLEQNKDLMEANKNFEFEVEVTVPKQEEIHGHFITNCQQCHFTCHEICQIPNDNDKIKCSAMKDGNCTVCPGKCVWSVHFNQKYKWIYEQRKEKQTYEEIKKNYEKAHGEVMTVAKIFQKLKKNYDIVKESVKSLITKSSRNLKRLREIALRPNPLSTTEYIDLMIQSEEQEAEPGYEERIQSLREVRAKAEIAGKIERGEDVFVSPKRKEREPSLRKKYENRNLTPSRDVRRRDSEIDNINIPTTNRFRVLNENPEEEVFWRDHLDRRDKQGEHRDLNTRLGREGGRKRSRETTEGEREQGSKPLREKRERR